MKLLELLKTLTSPELKKFSLFLKSPYHNTDQLISTFYENILRNSILSNHKIKNVKESFIQKHKIDDNKFRKTSHDTLKLLLEFKKIELLKKEKLIDDYLEIKSLSQSNWNILSKSKRFMLAESFKNMNNATSEDIALQFLIIKELLEINSKQKNHIENTHLYLKIKEITQTLTTYEELLVSLELENYKFGNLKFESTSKYSSQQENKIILIHKKILELYKTGNVIDSLDYILNEVRSNTALPKALKKDIIMKCVNYLIIRLNNGEINLFSNIFELYKSGIDEEFFPVDVMQYRNITYFACKSGEFDWALNFVENYKETLPIEEQESAYSFTKARTLWYAKDWSRVIETLRNVEYKDMTYNLLARSYIMTCYYELDEFEALDAFIKSFKVYLRRKRNVSIARKNSFINFTNVLGYLMKAAERNDYKQILKARHELDSNPATRNKDWLLEKIEELESIIPKPKKS